MVEVVEQKAKVEKRKGVRWFVIAIAYASFVGLGLYDGLLGVAWPTMRGSFGLPIDALGTLLLATTSGHITASFSNGRIIRSRGVAFTLIASGIMMGGAMLVQIIAPSWYLLLALGFIFGLGMGSLDSGLNNYAADNFRPRLLNWLHASFGVGTTLGAFLMTVILNANYGWRTGFGVIASFNLLVLILFVFTKPNWQLKSEDKTSEEGKVVQARSKETLRLPMVWLGIAIFFIYTGLEIGAGHWLTTLLIESRGFAAESAGLWATMYWGSLTIGRILLGFVEANLTRLVRMAMVGMIAGSFLLALNLSTAVSLAGIIVLGFSLAPVFPALIALTPGRVGLKHAPNAIGFQVGAAGIGAAILPATSGYLADSFGLELIAWFVVVAAVIEILLHETALWFERRNSNERVS